MASPDPTLRTLQAAVLRGDGDAVSVLHQRMRQLGGPAAQVVDGQSEAAWDELWELGEGVRRDGRLVIAEAVAWETMRRVRANVEVLLGRYHAIGYRLEVPDEALLPPADPAHIAALEHAAGGPLPLSMAAFWEHMAGVDLRQARAQGVHGWSGHQGGRPVDPVELLGDDDPLQVIDIAALHAELGDPESYLVGRLDGRTYLFFAADCFHKANVSGGENYHLLVPEPRADFRIIGDVSPEHHAAWSSYGGGQRFVSALRRTFQGGGFRGHLSPDPPAAWSPWQPIHRQLAEGLLPI